MSTTAAVLICLLLAAHGAAMYSIQSSRLGPHMRLAYKITVGFAVGCALLILCLSIVGV